MISHDAEDPTRTRVLWADPEPDAVEGHVQALRRAGFDVACVASLQELRAQSRNAFELIVLETAWPGEDGLAACQALADGEAAVLACSRAGSPLDCVASLEAGADDFVAASAHHVELTARARSLLRRRRASAPAEMLWRFNLSARRLTSPSGATVTLSSRCAALFAALCERQGVALPRAAIAARVYGTAEITSRAIDVAVARLRRKIDGCDGAGRFIRSVHAVGYLLEVDEGARLELQTAATGEARPRAGDLPRLVVRRG
jgi:DNA-binding response OmpR family regulator